MVVWQLLRWELTEELLEKHLLVLLLLLSLLLLCQLLSLSCLFLCFQFLLRLGSICRVAVGWAVEPGSILCVLQLGLFLRLMSSLSVWASAHLC